MKRALFAMLIAAALLAGCGSLSKSSADVAKSEPLSNQSYEMGGGAPVPMMELPAPTMAAPALDAARAANETAGLPSTAPDRMVVKNAELTIVVKDPNQSLNDISKMAADMGGYVVSSNLFQSYAPNGSKVPEVNVSIRVPAEKLDSVLEQIKAGAVEVQSENVSGQDVTSQYVDLQSQLTNLQAAESQLQEIMKQAQTTEDVLNVYNQLVSVRGQIEQIKGQMKYLEETSATSAINIHLLAEESLQPLQIAGWKPAGVVRDAIQDLIYFWQDFVDFLIQFVLNFIPKLLTILIVFGLPIWLIVRGIRNWRRKHKAVVKKETKE